MTNLETYNKIFKLIFKVKDEDLTTLRYRAFPNWDSVGHMDLMAELEEVFDIMIDTPDVLDFTSYEKGKEILSRYDVIIE